jgi:hypothetical protein
VCIGYHVVVLGLAAKQEVAYTAADNVGAAAHLLYPLYGFYGIGINIGDADIVFITAILPWFRVTENLVCGEGFFKAKYL